MSLTSRALTAAGALTTALVTSLAIAQHATARAAAPAVTYHFRTLDNSNDLTFNQLLGINNHGTISGYYGSGAQGHKNKGYLLLSPFRQVDYRVENFPGSAQTQVTGLNDIGDTVGFYSHTNDANPANNANFGFWESNGRFHKADYPTSNPASPPIDQLLGINSHGVAVGFYNDSSGNAHGYEYNVTTHNFSTINVTGATSVTATAINNNRAVVGFFTDAHKNVSAFLLTRNGTLTVISKSGADMTQAFGVNDHGEVVGVYTIGANSYGFTWTAGGGFVTVSDPHGIGTTILNGVNNAGDLVGFYTDSHNRVDGMLATP
jgi:probable HAF family extracellular repeat protein